MIIEYIILGIFFVSFAGVLIMLARKIPVLNGLPQNGTTGIRKHRFILHTEDKIKNIFVAVEKQILLHKLLSWVKIMTLKLEVRIDRLLHGIRKKAQQVDENLNKKK